ncbi:Rha family transcriptional regulator [Paenibacillus sp. UASWS1643]|uniref:Rha family transcriptional regulator n=1 Tax=Paenibacillus sp. UASWS1643 TaxID=2580422 RepID=UPI00123B1002|nr:phage regulatory protein/antirepressor Ant [Paenibacillus sp. UASWS1643]KAA8747144.1 Rha family transcriptional regulator [Paenibacillus sp. UASWS1643]
MTQLNIVNNQGKLLADSRDIATMIGKQHKHLLRDIDGYMSVLIESNFGPNDFFIETTYKDSIGRTLKRYDITKLGCDMVANKMTGQKGVLFTATYVSRFAEMERKMAMPNLPQNYKEALVALVDQVDKNEKLHTENLMLEQRVREYEPKMTYLDQILQSKDTVTVTQIAKDYGLSGTALNQILHEEKVQYKQNDQWLLYSKHQDKGYTKSRTIDIHHNSGERSVRMNTRWTQPGRLFIHGILSKRGIIPFMDRENPGA